MKEKSIDLKGAITNYNFIFNNPFVDTSFIRKSQIYAEDFEENIKLFSDTKVSNFEGDESVLWAFSDEIPTSDMD